MNIVLLCGRITRDPEVRYTQEGKAIAKYTLAVDRRGRNSDGADFISCVAFDKSAEFAEKYLRKGTKIIVRGRINTGSYTDRDGKKVYTTEVIVDDQEFAESKNSSPKSDEEIEEARDDRRKAEYEKKNAKKEDDFMPIPDDVDDGGLPFV